MPNWCSNSVVVYGRKDEVELFKERYKQAYVNSCKNNTWGTYELFAIHNYEDILNHPDWIRGPIYDSTSLEEDGTFRFFFESAWSPMIDGIKRILDERYETLQCEIISEECGECIYINTDTKGKYFKDKFCLYSDQTGSEYFETDEELAKFVKEEFELNIIPNKIKDDFYIEYAPDEELSIHRFVAY